MLLCIKCRPNMTELEMITSKFVFYIKFPKLRYITLLLTKFSTIFQNSGSVSWNIYSLGNTKINNLIADQARIEEAVGQNWGHILNKIFKNFSAYLIRHGNDATKIGPRGLYHIEIFAFSAPNLFRIGDIAYYLSKHQHSDIMTISKW